ncbi:MAG: hypothetical protein R3C18_16970 [Planctomycetaceae bacterium]
MPIKFRCPHCQQFLGISRAKAGVVTDCPMCGRTIRVPNLDGSVEELPQPKMDLDDKELRSALAALASLESDEPVPVVEQPKKVAPEVLSAPVAAVEVIPIEPEVYEEPTRSEPVPTPSPDPLKDLAEAPATVERPPKVEKRRTTGISGLVLLASVLASFAAGGLLGYQWGMRAFVASHPLPGMDELDGLDEGDGENGVVVGGDSVPSGSSSLSGRVTYKNSSGQNLNDAGARILLLPIVNPGQSKLPTIGFRAGAADSDRKLATASVQAIGGEFVVADATGHYSLDLPPGEYHLLMMSRYSPRDEGTALIDVVRDMSVEYFDRPQLLVGQVAYHYQSITITNSPQVVDYHFDGIPLTHLVDWTTGNQNVDLI